MDEPEPYEESKFPLAKVRRSKAYFILCASGLLLIFGCCAWGFVLRLLE